MDNNIPTDPADVQVTLKKLRKHLRDNQDLYVVGGISVTVGLILGKKLRKPVTIDRAAVLTDWMADMVKQGYSIYALDTQQTKLWNTVYDGIELAAKETGKSVSHEMDKVIERTLTFINTSPLRSFEK